MLYTLETVLHTAFATQPILTVASLEAAILKMPAFKQITAFKDAKSGRFAEAPRIVEKAEAEWSIYACTAGAEVISLYQPWRDYHRNIGQFAKKILGLECGGRVDTGKGPEVYRRAKRFER